MSKIGSQADVVALEDICKIRVRRFLEDFWPIFVLFIGGINPTIKQMTNGLLRLYQIDPPRSPCFSSNGLAHADRFASICSCLASAICHLFDCRVNNIRKLI